MKETVTAGESARDPFLAIARIAKTQGRRGEVSAEILTDFPARFQEMREAFLANGPTGTEAAEPVKIENAWPHKGRIILKFSGVDSISEAARLVGRHLLIPREERMPLPAHHYYLWELKGCRVITEREGVEREVGIVTEVESTGGAGLLHVARTDGRGGHDGRAREALIPLAQAICTRIDPAARVIVIDPPEDLLDLNG